MFPVIQALLLNRRKLRVLKNSWCLLRYSYKLAKGPQMNDDNNTTLLSQTVQIYSILYDKFLIQSFVIKCLKKKILLYFFVIIPRRLGF